MGTLPRRSRIDLEIERETVMRLSIERKSPAEIAQILGIDYKLVSAHLTTIRKRAAERAGASFDLYLAEGMAELDQLAAEAWAGWRRSVLPATVTQEQVETAGDETQPAVSVGGVPGAAVDPVTDPVPGERGPIGTGSGPVRLGTVMPTRALRHAQRTTVKTTAGDPRFLDVVLKTIELRMKMLGVRDARNPAAGATSGQIPLSWIRDQAGTVAAVEAEIMRLRGHDDERTEAQRGASGEHLWDS